MTKTVDPTNINIDTAIDLVEKQESVNQKKEKTTLSLGDKMVQRGLISADQLQVAMRVQSSQEEEERKMLGAILVELGFITESALGEVLTETSGVESFDIASAVLDPKLIRLIPKDVAVRNKVIPVVQQGEEIHLAITDVYNIIAIDQVRRYFPRNTKIVPIYAPESDITDIIDQYYAYEMSIDGILKELETGKNENQNINAEEDGYVNPTVRLVNAILVDAVKTDASDIHFEPEGAFLRIRYRIDGKLVQIRSLHKDFWPAIAVRIKIMSEMNIAESRKPQDGRIAYNISGREIDFRVATQPTIHGENIVMRLLDKKRSLVELPKLGFSEHNETLLKKLIKRPEGIIIVTGPTGSGKTTTLYSVLNHINAIDVNIMTLEDPVEYQLPLIRQANIREGAGMGFSEGIKSVMRQDPDIVFVGEVRDDETAQMAVRAAMTGHQVFTTLHTNNALGAIPRLKDIGVASHLLAGSLIGIIAQRLARRLCSECKTERHPTAEEAHILGLENSEQKIYGRQGCDACLNTGYKGRLAIHEILRVDKGLDDLVANNASNKELLEHANNNGFISMALDGIRKVLAGVTDVDELIRTIDMTDRL